MIKNNFHLAIPSNDLEESIAFYRSLNCKIGRTTSLYSIVDFFGCQLVLHYYREILQAPRMYPRHFGICMEAYAEFSEFYDYCVLKKLKFFEDMFVRFDGMMHKHYTFFLVDPSNNVVEFKHYVNGKDGMF